MFNPLLNGAVHAIKMLIVLFTVVGADGALGAAAHRMLPNGLHGPHPYLFDALTRTLYVVPPIMPVVFTAVVAVSTVVNPCISTHVSVPFPASLYTS